MPQASFKPIIEPRPPDKADFRGLEQLSWLMDRAITIPGTRITVALDAILGLLPIGGDVMTGLIQTGIVLVAMFHYRVPRPVAARMAANVLLDTAIGSIPLLGDAFDVFFKANTRNLKLLQQVHDQRIQDRPVSTWPSIAYLAFIVFALVTMLLLLIIGFIAVVAWLFQRPIL